MRELLMQPLMFGLCAVVAYALSNLLRCRVASISSAKTSQRIWVPLVPLTITLLGGIAVGLWGPTGKQDLSMGLVVLTFWQVVGFLIYVLPAGFAMWRAGEPLSSAGVSRQGLWQSGVIGLVLGGVWFAQSQLLGRSIRPDWPLAIPFLAAFAFAEEFLFRGYLQARFIATIGTWRGWALASIIFAAFHLPHFLIYNHLSATAALAATAHAIPSALTLGFIMLRTRNILAPAIFHTTINLCGGL